MKRRKGKGKAEKLGKNGQMPVAIILGTFSETLFTLKSVVSTN